MHKDSVVEKLLNGIRVFVDTYSLGTKELSFLVQEDGVSLCTILATRAWLLVVLSCICIRVYVKCALT